MMRFLTILLIVGFVMPFVPAKVSATEATPPSLEQQLQELTSMYQHLVRTHNLEDNAPLSTEEMRSVIEDGAAWIVNSQEDSGRFKYEYEPYSDSYLYGDNIVRQAGTLYALGEVLQHDREGKYDLHDTMKASMDRFVEMSKEDEFLGVEFSCFVEKKNSDRCRLGAVSLALVGFLSYVEAFPEEATEYEDIMYDYMAYIVNSKRLRTGFRDSHIVGINAQPSAESPYSDGEALLALVRYYQYAPNAIIKKTIDDTFSYLQTIESDHALYLWAMAALKDMHTLWPDDEYVSYARDFTNWRMKHVSKYRGSSKNYCSYVEGVASAYSIIASDEDQFELDWIKNDIDFWNTRNSFLQIADRDTYRYVQDGEGLRLEMIENMPLAYGGFLTSKEELTQRIDFTQHCVNAYLQTFVDIEGKSL